MIQQSHVRNIAHAYFFLTIIGFFIWIQLPLTYLIYLVGCHSTWYMFLASLLFADLGAFMLGKICFLLYPVYILALVVCYLIAAFKKKYKPLAVIAVIDVVFSCIMFLRYAQYAVANETVMSFLGLCLSLYTAIVLMRYKKQEQIYSTSENETNP